MGGANDEIQLRRALHQLGGPGQVQNRLPQLDAKAQLDAVPRSRLRGRELPGEGVPVIELNGVTAVPGHGLHVVGKADLVHPRPQGGLRHFRHGAFGIRGDAGVHMVISQIHGSRLIS